jgi:hypothetical protein
MIHLPNNHPYFISFTQGSAGRLVKYLLYNLLTNSSDELDIHPITNSTHLSDKRYSGYGYDMYATSDLEDPNNGIPACRNDIWNIIKFDNPPRDFIAPKIFATHVFPNFKLIRERLGPDVKFIIITINPKDLIEVVLNDKLKNYYDLITGISHDTPLLASVITQELIKRYDRFLGKQYPGTFVKEDIIQIAKSLTMEHLEYFLSKATDTPCTHDADADSRIGTYMNTPPVTDYPMNQVLYLPYNEIATYNNNGHLWLKKLEKFTGKKANEVTKESYQKYLNGRTQLMKEYRL